MLKLIEQASVDKAFAEDAVQSVTIHQNSRKQWHFTMEILEPSGEVGTYALRPQRFNEPRTWADADKLIDYLYTRMVRDGIFILESRE